MYNNVSIRSCISYPLSGKTLYCLNVWYIAAEWITNAAHFSLQDKFLNMIGDKHQNFEFLRTLSLKCSHNIFSSEHVSCILNHISRNSYRNKDLEASSVRLLQVQNFAAEWIWLLFIQRYRVLEITLTVGFLSTKCMMRKVYKYCQDYMFNKYGTYGTQYHCASV